MTVRELINLLQGERINPDAEVRIDQANNGDGVVDCVLTTPGGRVMISNMPGTRS